VFKPKVEAALGRVRLCAAMLSGLGCVLVLGAYRRRCSARGVGRFWRPF
jgi:hypothetical protein